jgi:hypothetical protein
VRYSATSRWRKIDSKIQLCITAADMTGSGRSDIIGSYENGTWYRDSATETLENIAPPATQLITIDINGDGRDDLVGIWPDGVRVRYGATGQWQQITSSKPSWIFASGIADDVQTDVSLHDPLESSDGKDIVDLSMEGPGTANIISLEEKGPDSEK